MAAPTVIPPLTSDPLLVSSRTSRTVQERVPGQSIIERLVLAGEPLRPRSVVGRVLGFDPLDAAARAEFTAAMGESAVAQQLAALSAGWTVLHSLPSGRNGADIDHLVVGPGGVFTITAATHRMPSAVRADAGVRCMQRLLGTGRPVRALVAVSGSHRIRQDRIGSAAVVRTDRLRHVLEALPVRYGPDGVAAIVSRLERGDLWPSVTVAEPELLVRFAALQRQVLTARRLRRAWQVAGVVSTLAAGVLLAH